MTAHDFWVLAAGIIIGLGIAGTVVMMLVTAKPRLPW